MSASRQNIQFHRDYLSNPPLELGTGDDLCLSECRKCRVEFKPDEWSLLLVPLDTCHRSLVVEICCVS